MTMVFQKDKIDRLRTRLRNQSGKLDKIRGESGGERAGWKRERELK